MTAQPTSTTRRIVVDSLPVPVLQAFLDAAAGQDSLDRAYPRFEVVHANVPVKVVPRAITSRVTATSSRLLSRGVGAAAAPWILTRSEMAELRIHQGLFFEELSRHDLRYRNFTVHEMGVHYFELVNFWVHKLREQQVDACFAGQLPRLPSTLALYISAKLIGIPYLYLELGPVLNRFRMFGCSLSHRAALVATWGTTSGDFVDGFNEYVDNIRTSDDAETPIYMRQQKRRREPVLIRARRIVQKVPEKLAERRNKTPSPSPPDNQSGIGEPAAVDPRRYRHIAKNNRRRWDDPKASFNFFSTRWYRLEGTLAQASRRRRYRRQCTPVATINGPFLYFAAHLQPEASTLPATLDARYQYLALRRLVERLPEGVTIAYKENPKTFNDPGLGRVYWKSKWFHDEILALGRTVLVDDRVDTLELIRSSVGVASVLGTVTVEAVVRGRRAITFAPTWHDHLDGVHLVDTTSDIDAAFEAMLNGSAPQPDPRNARFDRNFLPIDLNVNDADGRTRLIAGYFNAWDDWRTLAPDVRDAI